MNAKQRAVELYNQFIELASTDGRKFRKTVLETLIAETGCTVAAAAVAFNTVKGSHTRKKKIQSRIAIGID